LQENQGNNSLYTVTINAQQLRGRSKQLDFDVNPRGVKAKEAVQDVKIPNVSLCAKLLDTVIVYYMFTGQTVLRSCYITRKTCFNKTYCELVVLKFRELGLVLYSARKVGELRKCLYLLYKLTLKQPNKAG
jgi:hypothetical protein